MLDVLINPDVPGRPLRYEPADGRPPPWVQMTEREFDTAVTDTNAAYEAWLRGVTPDPVIAGPVLPSPDGQSWEITIGNTGTIGRRKV